MSDGARCGLGYLPDRMGADEVPQSGQQRIDDDAASLGPFGARDTFVILRDTPLPVAVLDADSRYVFVNESTARMNGLAADDHVGRTVLGPESGPFEIVRVVASSPECGEPVLFTSRDHRVLGFITGCDEGPDPTAFGRCLISGEAGRVVMHCGERASAAGVVGASDEEEYD